MSQMSLTTWPVNRSAFSFKADDILKSPVESCSSDILVRLKMATGGCGKIETAGRSCLQMRAVALLKNELHVFSRLMASRRCLEGDCHLEAPPEIALAD
jgi:hypothetical protein